METNSSAHGLCAQLKADMRALGLRRVTAWMMPVYFLVRPGFMVICLYRLSAACHGWGNVFGRVMAKFFWRVNVLCSGCYIEPEAQIGAGMELPHPTGVVIGGEVVIGEQVTIYQHVTLGLRHSASGYEKGAFPTIGNNVIIYSGAVILGKIRIGNNARIGANAVVTHDVDDNMVAVGIPARQRPMKVE